MPIFGSENKELEVKKTIQVDIREGSYEKNQFEEGTGSPVFDGGQNIKEKAKGKKGIKYERKNRNNKSHFEQKNVPYCILSLTTLHQEKTVQFSQYNHFPHENYDRSRSLKTTRKINQNFTQNHIHEKFHLLHHL